MGITDEQLKFLADDFFAGYPDPLTDKELRKIFKSYDSWWVRTYRFVVAHLKRAFSWRVS